MNMTVLVALAAGATFGQGPAPAGNAAEGNVKFNKSRMLRFPMTVSPGRIKELKEITLFVSRDQGDTYEFAQKIDPTDTKFTYTAREDGVYWFQIQDNFLNGVNVPKSPRDLAPAEKIVIDTTKPAITITNAAFIGDEVSLEWRIEEKHPDDSSTRIFYMPGADSAEAKAWREVPAKWIAQRTARFKPDFTGSIVLKVDTADLAWNQGTQLKELTPGLRDVAYRSSGIAPIKPVGMSETQPMAKEITLPPMEPPAPAANIPMPAAMSLPPSTAPTLQAPSMGQPIAIGGSVPARAPAPPLQPAAAAATETTPAPAQLMASKTPRFDLNYTLDGGPSGVARIDLYVTRDDGRTWIRWSSHDGRELPLKVVLDTRMNREVEGDYGFILVPTSGAGLSEPAPTANTAPECRVRVDTTAPVIRVYQPTADPNNKQALMLNWEATDLNFGKEPIAIEYAEEQRGPWKSATAPEPTGLLAGTSVHRIENMGTFSWQPPANLATPKVYLRFTAWDTAGNKNEAVTPMPILIDLTKPRAKIQGITASVPR